MKYSLQVGIVGASSDMGGREMPGTYNKMEEGEEREGGRRHKHRHHSHHRHRGEREASRHGRQTSTDTSLDLGRTVEEASMDVESKYQDSLYGPQQTKDSLYSPGRESLYSGEEGRYNSGGEARQGGRFSPRPHSKGWDNAREQRGENTFDHVSRGMGRRGQEERIWQDPVSRGAESGQIRAPPPGHGHSSRNSGKPEASPLRAGYIEPGRPGSGLAAAAALARGEPHAVQGGSSHTSRGGKVPPPVAQKPEKAKYNKLGMEEVWAGGWEDYSEYHSHIYLHRQKYSP